MIERLPILENTPLFIMFALLVVAFVVWRIRTADFRQIQRLHFALAAFLFWGTLATILILSVWDSYYAHFAPPTYKVLAPLASILVYPLWSLALRWLAIRLPGSPAASFCLLGGLQGIFEHWVAIYGLNILKAPRLESSTPLAIFIFSFFEYIVYWGVVLILADGIRRLVVRLRHSEARSVPP